MKSLAIVFGFLAILVFAGNVEANASIDPMAHEVVMQTWYGKIPQAKRMHYCDTQNAKSIVKRYNKNATRQGKAELRKAYRFYILNNC
jgi:hypothetical protein